MYRAGDHLNPYDPCKRFFANKPEAEFMARMQDGARIMQELMNDPEKRAEYERMMREDAEERARTGETMDEQIMREKREWAEADAKSSKLKEEGNEAFRKGEYKTAYVIYTVCMILSGHEPLYPLNRAAVALKLKLYEKAVEDASGAIERGDWNRAKALFRRAQGNTFLGKWVEADEDYTKALTLLPGDRNIAAGFEELKRLQSLPAEDQATWISEQEKATILDVFEAGELKKLAKGMLKDLGYNPEKPEFCPRGPTPDCACNAYQSG